MVSRLLRFDRASHTTPRMLTKLPSARKRAARRRPRGQLGGAAAHNAWPLWHHACSQAPFAFVADAVRDHHLVVLVLDDVAVPDVQPPMSKVALTRVTSPG